MRDRRWPRLEREHRVERRDAVGVGRRDGQPAADIVEATLADPADTRLEGVERRQEHVAPRPGRVPAADRVAFRPDVPGSAGPGTHGRSDLGIEDGVDRRALDR
jgi:hypothetical protein